MGGKPLLNSVACFIGFFRKFGNGIALGRHTFIFGESAKKLWKKSILPVDKYLL